MVLPQSRRHTTQAIAAIAAIVLALVAGLPQAGAVAQGYPAGWRARLQAGWSAPANLSTSGVDVEGGSIVVDSSGRVHVAWSAGESISHRYASGGSWSSAQRVSSGHSPDLAASTNGRIYLAFGASLSDGDDVYVATWQASSGWSLPVNVSDNPATSSSPRLAIDVDGSLSLVWSEQDAFGAVIYLGRSSDGRVWSTSPLPNASGSRPVAVFAKPAELWVAWQDVFDLGFPTDVFVSHSTASGWSLPEDVSASPMADSQAPVLAATGDKVYLAWQEGASGLEAVYGAVATASAWSAPEPLSSVGRAMAPSLALDPVAGHLVWTTASTVQHAVSTLASGAWQPAEDVALGQTEADQARLAVPGALHLVWLAESSPGQHDLYYSTASTASPTVTATATHTAAVTPTATATPSPSPTTPPTATDTPWPSVTASPSPTPSPTPTLGPPATPTRTMSPGWHVWLPVLQR